MGPIQSHRPVGMQAYYRIKTQNSTGTIRCLTQPLNSSNTAFQDCLADTKDITQTFYINPGNVTVSCPTWGRMSIHNK